MISVHYRELNLDKVDEAWDRQDLQVFKLPGSNDEFDIQDGLQKTDQERILAEIIKKDIEFITTNNRAQYSEILNFQNEEMLVWLFKAALNISIEDEDFFINNAVTGIPLELWVQLFQKLSPSVMDTLKDKCKKSNYSFEDFRKYLLGIKTVVKYCLDNHSQMITYYDGGTSGIMRDRAMKIYKRLNPEQVTVV